MYGCLGGMSLTVGVGVDVAPAKSTSCTLARVSRPLEPSRSVLAFDQPSSAIPGILPDLADDGQTLDTQVDLCFDFGAVMACVELFATLP